MTICALLADEVTAVGFRLAGVAVDVPQAADLRRRFERLCDEAQLVLITAELARQLPPAVLQRRQRAVRPLVLVIPDVRGRCEPPDLGIALRRQLGMAE
jgi:vacuolar-type H+-ATPase subunit F/Vma7